MIQATPSKDALLGGLKGRMLSTYLPNTVLYAVGTALIVMVLAALAGYGFSRYHFRGHDALMVAIFAITGVPLLTNLLALYQMGVVMRKLPIPIYNDRVYIMIVYTGFFLPISIWIAKGFFDAIPRELEEAGQIDGCSPIGGLVRIVMPLMTPGLTAMPDRGQARRHQRHDDAHDPRRSGCGIEGRPLHFTAGLRGRSLWRSRY